MALTEKLTAVADAIRAKTGGIDKMTLAEMPNQIAKISGVDDTVVEYDQQNSYITKYLSDSADYTDSNYGTGGVSHYDDLVAGNDTCVGKELTGLGAATHLLVAGEEEGEGVQDISVSNGTATVYNLVPGRTYRWIARTDDGTTTATGRLKATGQVRFLHMEHWRNVRDLGGWTCDGGTVKYGKLFRSAAPNNADSTSYVVTANDIEEAKRIGINWEIDLRGGTESGVSGEPLLNVLYLHEAWAKYNSEIYTDSSTVSYAADVMEAIVHGYVPVYHCQAGADRTQRMTVILLGLLGVSIPDLDREYELTSLYSARHRDSTDGYTDCHDYIKKIDGDTMGEKTFNAIKGTGAVSLQLANQFRNAMIDGTPSALTWDHTVTLNLTNCAAVSSVSTVSDGDTLVINLEPSSGMVLLESSVTVTMNEVEQTDAANQMDTYVLVTIPKVTGDVVITAVGASDAYSVTNSLTHASTSNSATSVAKNARYSATIVPDTGYELASINVTMGGTDISSTAVTGGGQ